MEPAPVAAPATRGGRYPELMEGTPHSGISQQSGAAAEPAEREPGELGGQAVVPEVEPFNQVALRPADRETMVAAPRPTSAQEVEVAALPQSAAPEPPHQALAEQALPLELMARRGRIARVVTEASIKGAGPSPTREHFTVMVAMVAMVEMVAHSLALAAPEETVLTALSSFVTRCRGQLRIGLSLSIPR